MYKQYDRKLAHFPSHKSKMFSKNKQSEYMKALASLLGSITENDSRENILQQGLFGSPRLPLLALTLMYMQEMKMDFSP